METTVNRIIPHEDRAMEVHVSFRDKGNHAHPSADVIVFVEKQDHPLSEVKRVAIQKA